MKNIIPDEFGVHIGGSARDKRRASKLADALEAKNNGIELPPPKKRPKIIAYRYNIFCEPRWNEVQRSLGLENAIRLRVLYERIPAKAYFNEAVSLITKYGEFIHTCIQDMVNVQECFNAISPENDYEQSFRLSVHNAINTSVNCLIVLGLVKSIDEGIFFHKNIEITKSQRLSKCWLLMCDSPLTGKKHILEYLEEGNIDKELIIKRILGTLVMEKPERKIMKVQRIGEDYRDGRNISVEEFQQTFAFRGIEFGTYVHQKMRQDLLNYAFDAFMDLSKFLKLEPRMIAHNALNFAFCARGGGWIPYAAHYEFDTRTINITKSQGAGTIAHEYMHFMDYTVGRAIGNTKRPHASTLDNFFDTKFYKDAYNYDNYREFKYYSKPDELMARAFEALVYAHINNTFLVSLYSDSWVTPNDEELERLTPYLENFIEQFKSVIKYKNQSLTVPQSET